MMRLIWQINWTQDGRGFPCLFHFFTGFYCPGCGGTRAVRLLLQGNLVKSFVYHPFVLYMAAAVFAECCFLGADGILAFKEKSRLKDRYMPKFKKRYSRWVLAGAGIVGANWVIKNLFLLAGIDLLLPI